MSKRTISILGCGWLGRPLGTALVDSGFLVMGSTTRNENMEALQAAGIVPVLLQVGESFAGRIAHPFFNADILVISLPQRVRAGEAAEYVGQIREVTNAALRGNVRNIILLSTTSAYPNLNRVVTEEDADAHNPVVRAEMIVRQSGISNTILRLSGLYGPGRHPGKFLAGKTDVAGANVPVNMIHLDDCIEIIKSIIQRNLWNDVLNVCADDHPTRKTFYTSAAIALGLQPPVFSVRNDADYKIVSNARLKAILNYTFIHRLI